MRYRSIYYAALVCCFLSLAAVQAAPAPDLEDRTREISAELRCVVCQNLSVADSPSEMAQQMRAVVREQLQAGKTPEQIREFFVSKYGEWVLLKPKTTGFALLLWILPYVALLIGVIAALWIIWRWTKANKQRSIQSAQAPATAASQYNLIATNFETPHLDDSSPRAQSLREGQRLKNELNELEFDFQSGKVSEPDFQSLKQEIEAKGVSVLRQLDSLPAPRSSETPKEKPPRAAESKNAPAPARFSRWRLVTGGVFLLLFGLTLGVLLTQSVRPRASENDTITGDFMTGTPPASAGVRAALDEGKQAFSQQEFPKAIEAFKKALAADPNNPEAHAYMGFILVQAGHADGALMAFDKALAAAPNFPMALWGKGMVLYREQKDYVGAREILEKLLNLMPPSAERNEIAKVLMEIPASGAPKSQAAAPKPAQTAPLSQAQIRGTITVDPKLKASIDPNAALFIIARAAGAAVGPPLAVKKIDKPTFPLAYSLSQENVMMQGTPFTGKITVIARLDKDGNPVTRGPGDLTGEYKKNPVEVGAQNVDFVVDQVMR
jgi:cytochrome c-type biogenesis protein CcmH